MKPEADFHAGMIETSVMMYWKPELVRSTIVMDDEYTAKMMHTDQDWFEKREKSIDHPFIIETVGQRDEIEVGVMGFPERTSRDLGKKACDEMIENLVKYIDLLEEKVNSGISNNE